MSKRTSVLLWLVSGFLALCVSNAQTKGAPFGAELLEKENVVTTQLQGGGWKPAAIGMKLQTRDRVSTGARSRAVHAATDRTIMRMDERTIAEVGASSIT
ncbi:MAG: hypothetical protein ABIZ56_13085, partial [Chthoniobacteraceae bacterium]